MFKPFHYHHWIHPHMYCHFDLIASSSSLSTTVASLTSTSVKIERTRFEAGLESTSFRSADLTLLVFRNGTIAGSSSKRQNWGHQAKRLEIVWRHLVFLNHHRLKPPS